MNPQVSAPAAPRDLSESQPSEQVDLRREFNEVGIGEVLDHERLRSVGIQLCRKTHVLQLAEELGKVIVHRWFPTGDDNPLEPSPA